MKRMRALSRVAVWALCFLLGCATAPLAAQEVATVDLRGEDVFTVAAVDTISAPVRARRISERLRARLQTEEPLAPLRMVWVENHAAVVVGTDTLVQVTPGDAEVAAARPLSPGATREAVLRLAGEWAVSLSEVFGRLAAAERARVVVEGLPLFEVGGTAELRAARRAAAIGLQISQVAAAPGDVPEIRAVSRERGAAVVAGERVLVEISAAEAAVRDTEPLVLAAEWAGQIREAVRIVREQGTVRYLLRIFGLTLLAVLAAGLLHWMLRRLETRVETRELDPDQRWGLLPVVGQWVLGVLRFLVWAALAVYVLWLIPRTRPLTFTAADRALEIAAQVGGWLVREGLLVLLIVVGTFFAARFTGAVVRYLIRVFGVRHGGRTGLRAGTLAGTVANAAQLVVAFLGLIAVLAQLDINPVSLVAGAGVAGIAIGFGVQSLIRDFFTGFFILLEDQYGVGDVITVGAITGKVEEFTLRITQIRGLDGSLTSIPNGEITTVANLSKDWAQAVLDIHIAMGENVDRATEVIAETASRIAADLKEKVRGEPEVLGVETVDPLSHTITIRVIMKTAPLERWSVARELRRRILRAFEEEDIKTPPRAVVTLGDGDRGLGPPPANPQGPS
jgi:small-conductance mechanosensitive channel